MALDATRCIRSERMRGVAPCATLMSSCQLRIGRLGRLACVTPHTEIGRFGSGTMDRVALRTILVRRYVRLDVLIDDLAVA